MDNEETIARKREAAIRALGELFSNPKVRAHVCHRYIRPVNPTLVWWGYRTRMGSGNVRLEKSPQNRRCQIFVDQLAIANQQSAGIYGAIRRLN
jgi:hypothetical protein